MSQLTEHPAYVQVADLLDSVGQRYRVFCMVRGAAYYSALLAGSTVLAGLLASIAGTGGWTRVIGGTWLLVNLAGAWVWVLKPLLLRPRPLQVARLVEQQVEGIHNGLTNLVQLAHANDLAENPWMGEVFSEVATRVADRPVHEAVRFGSMTRGVLKAWGLALPLLIAACLVPGRLGQGLTQMVRPTEFVPMVGKAEIVEVTPGNTTLIKGRSLDVSVSAKEASEASALIYFEGETAPLPMAGGAADHEGLRRFTYYREHVDASTRYRVEVGGTQSPWYTINAIKQVGLASVSLNVLPPAYTRQPAQTINLEAADLEKQPVTVPQGSKVQLAFTVDVGVSAGMMQLGDAAPIPATVSAESRRFSAEAVFRDQTPVSLLLTDGGGQIIARVPESPLVVHVTTDAAPTIEMKWPTQDVSVAPTRELRIEANLKDDYGLSGARLLWSTSAEEPMVAAVSRTLADKPTSTTFSAALPLTAEQSAHGKSIWVQVEATDNRDLLSLASDLGPQTVQSRKMEIRFRDPSQLARELAEKNSKLRARLELLLKQQRELHTLTSGTKDPAQAVLQKVQLGQSDLRTSLLDTAQTFEFDAQNRVVQKTLQVLAGGAAQEAVEFARAAGTEQDVHQRVKLVEDLQSRQRRVIQTLESLLAILNASPDLKTESAQRRGGDLENPREAYEKLAEALKQYMKEERRILDQTATLAKKPVDNFDEKDKKLLNELGIAQEKLDAFMQEKVHDFSNVAEQDMANASLLKELIQVYSETTMAKDSLKDKAVEMAISAEEMGLELAKETSSNIEKWLADKPDRQKWTQEDQLQKTEAPMPELPTQLEDMVGELMEQQEDLFDEMEDANANWHDSMDKGIGWDAADGPIDNMTAKGVTGNQLPNNNEMGGRSGEGRSGKSQGEMVGDTAVGKGGRNTPTRLDPTAFQKGQINDISKDPTGGATGGGKLSGQGGEGLEGPVGPKLKQQMQRLAQKQAELRNAAERLDLQYKLGRYDNFKLLESIAIMRRVESDLNANRYQTALRRKDILLDAMDNSRTLLGGQISVQHDTTPAANRKQQQEINDAMKGTLPPAWEGALKEYYKKLGQE